MAVRARTRPTLTHILSQVHQMSRYSITIAAMVVAEDASRVYVAEQSRSEETLTADSCNVRSSTYAIAHTQATTQRVT